MKFFIKIFILLLTNINIAIAQNCNDISTFSKLVSEQHFLKPVFNEEMAQICIENTIKNIDPFGFFILINDYSRLLNHKENFFEKDGFCNFIDDLIKTIDAKIEERKKIDFAFIKKYDNDYFRFDDQNLMFENEAQSYTHWEKWLKYQYNKSTIQLEGENDTTINNHFLKKIDCFFDNFYMIGNDKMTLYTSLLFNSILETIDPHSTYIPASFKEVFDASLSSDISSFGFNVAKDKNGDLEIEEIFTGSSAFYSTEINKGDKLISIGWNNKDIDFLPCANENLVNFKLQTTKSKEITLSLKDNFGEIQKVTLKKEIIKNNENTIQAFLLEGPKKIAYLALPSFYYGNQESLGCANDIAKELIQLKADKYEGLIIDLRNNSGGSLFEAVDISGMFIDEGALMIDSSTKNSKPMLIKDFNRGYIFNGPIVVLINGYSASASEMVAMILKTYNKAIIVGEKSFGKASGQSFFSLNKDFLKLTTTLYTNLEGISYQKNGVEPDIILPELESVFYSSESDYNFSINPIKIIKNVNYQKNKELPIEQLKINSMQRVANDTIFQSIINSRAVLLNSIEESKNIPLSIEKYTKYLDIFKDTNKEKYLVHNNSNFEVTISKNKSFMFDFDESFKIDIENAIKTIKSDPQINESFNIIIDYINLKN